VRNRDSVSTVGVPAAQADADEDRIVALLQLFKVHATVDRLVELDRETELILQAPPPDSWLDLDRKNVDAD